MTSFCLTICALSMVLGDLAASFSLPNLPGQQWVKVGYLNMTDPMQQCPYPWQTVTSPVASCEKRASVICDSVNITTSGASYEMVCGRFLGYQIGSPDAFYPLTSSLETRYVDGVSITYGSPGNRTHVYTYAAGWSEYHYINPCPCAGGTSPPAFVGSDYYCESGNPNSTVYATFYYADVLWDGQLCRHDEVTCCDPPNLPWFCKNFTHPITENMEVRICLDEGPENENVALEFFELYILVSLSPQTFALSPVASSPTQLSASWSAPIPMNAIITAYSVYCNTSANQSYPEQVIGSNVPTIISVVNGATLAVTLTGLNPYTQYSCYVTANTSVGEGSPSNIVTVQTAQSVPSSPLNFTLATFGGSPTQLSASWSAPIPKNGIITAYSVYCNNQTSKVPTFRSVVNRTTLAVTLTGHNPCIQYGCYVTANTSVGEGSPSTIQSGKTCSCGLNSSSGSGTYRWPEVAIGQTISQMCQYGVVGQNITRLCNGDLTWTEDASQCPTVVTYQFRQLNAAIKNQTITAVNVVNITAQLQALVSQAIQVVDQSISNMVVVTNVITQISNISSTVPLQTQTIINVVTVLNSIQSWPTSVLSTYGPVVVENFETIVTNLIQKPNFTQVQVVQNQTVLIAEKLPLQNLTIEGKNFSTQGDTQTPGGMTNTTDVPGVPKLSASVSLPPSLFTSIAANLTNRTNIGIFFSIYKTASFFPLRNPVNSTIVAPLVIGVTVVGEMINNLTDPIVLNFTIPNKNYSNYLCVSWNFQAAGGAGNWTTDGCVTYVRQSNHVASNIECQCFHLTNFAILVDISSRVQPNQPLNKIVQRALEVISYIGVALSLFGLVLALAAHLLIKKLRQKDISIFHIQLCSALIGMLLVFVVGIDKTENFGGCVTVSVLIHFFTLVAVMWMGAEALYMFQKIVIVFVRISMRYIIAISLICWVVPLVPVTIPLCIDRNLLVRHNSTEGYCFINNVTVFFAAFLGPILLVLAFNAVIFVVVIVVLVKHLIKRSKEQVNSSGTIKRMANITGIFCLLGLTWVFGALTVMKADQAFQIVFTLTNSLQGFFIFIFFCVLNGDVRSTWLKTLPCKRLTTKMMCTTKEPSKPQSTSGLAVESDHTKDMGWLAQQVELNVMIINGDVDN